MMFNIFKWQELKDLNFYKFHQYSISASIQINNANVQQDMTAIRGHGLPLGNNF